MRNLTYFLRSLKAYIKAPIDVTIEWALFGVNHEYTKFTDQHITSKINNKCAHRSSRGKFITHLHSMVTLKHLITDN